MLSVSLHAQQVSFCSEQLIALYLLITRDMFRNKVAHLRANYHVRLSSEQDVQPASFSSDP